MKNLKRVSRWITVNSKMITNRHSLWCYADKEDKNDKNGYILYFRWNGREYAMQQFISRFSMYGFDKECKEFPSFIHGYDADGNVFRPLLIEIDEHGEKVRLYLED